MVSQWNHDLLLSETFTNETKPENFNKEYTDLAHKRTLEFYEKYLN